MRTAAPRSYRRQEPQANGRLGRIRRGPGRVCRAPHRLGTMETLREFARTRCRPGRPEDHLLFVPNTRRFRLLALDVDGTLLDPDGTLRPRTAAAVARAARAGLRPVLCTGRRYRRARPIADQLGLDAPLVCNSGAIVKDPADHRTLWRADFDAALLAEILDLFRAHDQLAVTFTDRTPDDFDFVVDRAPTGRPLFDEYLDLNRSHAEVDPGWTARVEGGLHFHLCAIGARPEMLAFERAVLGRLAGSVQTFVQKSPRYAGTMCE